jgi:hypothetical protein
MTCQTCASGAVPSVLTMPFQERSAAEAAASMQALVAAAMVSNCAVEGKVLAFGIDGISVLAAADGVTSKTNDDPAAGPIDFLTIQPFSKQDLKLHGLIIQASTAADLAALSVGQIQLDGGRDIRPRIRGSFVTQLTPAESLNCDGGLYKCGVDVLNASCLRPGNFNDPYEILLSNDTGLDIALVSITVLVEYM